VSLTGGLFEPASEVRLCAKDFQRSNRNNSFTVTLVVNGGGGVLQRALTCLVLRREGCQLLPIDFAVNRRNTLSFCRVLFCRGLSILLRLWFVTLNGYVGI